MVTMWVVNTIKIIVKNLYDYMKMGFISQRIEMFLFLTTNMAAMTLRANHQYERVGISIVEQDF